MIMSVNYLRKGCPEEIKKDMRELIYFSRKFFDDIDLYPHQDIEEVKLDVQEAKDLLLQMLSRFLTIISNNLEPTEDSREIGHRLKFGEDMGTIIYGMKERGFGGNFERLIPPSKIRSFAGELETIYDFTIFHPIITANKSNEKDLNKYIYRIFKVIRINASILANSEKLPGAFSVSRMMLPRSSSMIASGSKKGGYGGDDKIPRIDIAEDFNFTEDFGGGAIEDESNQYVE